MAVAVREVPTAQTLRDTVDEIMARHHVPGIAVGIHDGESEIYECFGVTSVDNPLTVTEDTLFQIGSTTKTMTALAVMRLVEAGKLDLDIPVKSYLTDFAMSDARVTEELTLRHLLNHTSGFDGDYFTDLGRGDEALAKCVAAMQDLSQISPFGEVYSYCNAGFYLTGRLIEVATGKTYEAAVRELVIEPLGMNASFFFPEEVMVYRFAVGHNVNGDEVKIAKPWALPRIVAAAGGITASIRDNMRYARFWLGDGTTEQGDRILSEANFKLMQSSLTPAELDDYVGLSWFSKQSGEVRVVRHGGDTNGQSSAFLFVPEQQFALAVLTNAGLYPAHQEIVRWVLKHFLGIEDAKPVPIEASDHQLDQVVGDYETLSHTTTVTRVNSHLSLKMEYKPEAVAVVSEEPPPPLPPMSAALTGSDRFVLVDGPYKDLAGEIIRRDGKIRWLRLGGRINTRISS